MNTMNTTMLTEIKERTIRVSEIFLSIEGEGPFTGWPMLFVRTFGCNFTCPGFGKHEPVLDYSKVLYVGDIEKVEYGCDSSYSWHGSAKHLTQDLTSEQLVKQIFDVIEAETGTRSFEYANGQSIILCFTGGEPLLWQPFILKTLQTIEKVPNNKLFHVLFETNTTQELQPEFKRWTTQRCLTMENNAKDFIFAMSPKLSNSGEPWSKAIVPEVLAQYAKTGAEWYLKFVCDNSERSWSDIHAAIAAFGAQPTDVWIMPEAATDEQQNAVAATIAKACIKKGFKYCHRTHVSVFGNKAMT